MNVRWLGMTQVQEITDETYWIDQLSVMCETCCGEEGWQESVESHYSQSDAVVFICKEEAAGNRVSRNVTSFFFCMRCWNEWLDIISVVKFVCSYSQYQCFMRHVFHQYIFFSYFLSVTLRGTGVTQTCLSYKCLFFFCICLFLNSVFLSIIHSLCIPPCLLACLSIISATLSCFVYSFLCSCLSV